MSKHRAIIVGCGRIGVGRNWIETPYVYTHVGAYAALKDRVSLEAVVDADPDAVAWAKAKLGVPGYTSLDVALETLRPDTVSLCTPPDPAAREAALVACWNAGVRGVWCEKPYAISHSATGLKVQVNYIRRFMSSHTFWSPPYPTLDHGVEKWPDGEVKWEHRGELWVWAKKDIHTVCHFTDLARMWEIDKKNLHYFEMNGPNSYVFLRRGRPIFFPLGGIDGCHEGFGLWGDQVFMEGALKNLLDAVEGKAELISPPESAIESEKWANEILGEKA